MAQRNKVLIASVFVLTQNAWAAGGSESMDRPSANSPSRPEFLTPKQGFNLPTLPESTTPLAPSSGKIFIERYTFSGNTVFDDDELHSLTLQYENRLVRTDELEELRQNITHYYINSGYINSGARIPKNALQNGVLNFDIIEGKLDDVQVHGQEGLNEDYIKHRLRAGEVLNVNDLQEQFQLLLVDPLILTLNGNLLPSSNPNHSTLDLNVTRARPYQLTFFTNNYRPPSIGAEAGGVSSWVRNLTGWGDLLDFTFQGSEGSLAYNGGWSVPISSYGTQAFFRFTEGDSSVIEQPTEKLDVKSQVHTLEGGISHPIIDSLKRKLTLSTSFAVRENEITLAGRPFSFISGEPTGHTQVTVVRFSQEHIERMMNQVLALRSTFSFGLNALGSTPRRNSTDPSSDFFTWLGQAQYGYKVLENGAQVVLKGNTQFSNHALLPLERMAVGGVNTVRGYRENQLVRDEGFNTSVEFHYPLFGDANSEHSLSLVPFMDYGGAWNHGESANYLHSAGIGLNWKFYNINSEFYWAHKINSVEKTKYNDDLQDDGIHFQVKIDAF